MDAAAKQVATDVRLQLSDSDCWRSRLGADTHGLDPQHVALWGASSGGHLAAFAGATDSTRAFDPPGPELPLPRVRAVVSRSLSGELTPPWAPDSAFMVQERLTRGIVP